MMERSVMSMVNFCFGPCLLIKSDFDLDFLAIVCNFRFLNSGLFWELYGDSFKDLILRKK